MARIRKSDPTKHSSTFGRNMRSGKEKTQGAPTISQKKTVQKSDRAITPSRDGRILLYGRNAVLDAVKNKNRMIHRLYKGPRLNREILDKIREVRPDLLPTGVSPEQLEATFPDKAPHQDILIEVSPLSQASLHDLAEKPGPSLFLMLTKSRTRKMSGRASDQRLRSAQKASSPRTGTVQAKVVPWRAPQPVPLKNCRGSGCPTSRKPSIS